ncbi:hypothetical protein DITRI_Ditri04bG0197000 [Diplodiscus trichospermus]
MISKPFRGHHRHAKKDNGGLCPPPLKVSKDSHLIKKSSSSSSSSSSTAPSSLDVTCSSARPPQQQRHPVIIYTHSPKIIRTHPKDFMALVQKLTGLSRNGDDHNNHNADTPPQPRIENSATSAEEHHKRINNDDSESSSVPSLFDPLSAPILTNIPVFTPISADFRCPDHPPYYNHTDSLFFTSNMRSSISSSSGLEG